MEATIPTTVRPEPVEGQVAQNQSASTGSARTDLGEHEALTIKIARTRTGFKLTTRGASHIVRVLPGHIAHLADYMIEKIPPDMSKYLICPMPGLLVALHVGEGDKVEAGQPLAVVEAMKMENILRAEKSGVVKSINAVQGESLAVDAIILELE